MDVVLTTEISKPVFGTASDRTGASIFSNALSKAGSSQEGRRFIME